MLCCVSGVVIGPVTPLQPQNHCMHHVPACVLSETAPCYASAFATGRTSHTSLESVGSQGCQGQPTVGRAPPSFLRPAGLRPRRPPNSPWLQCLAPAVNGFANALSIHPIGGVRVVVMDLGELQITSKRGSWIKRKRGRRTRPTFAYANVWFLTSHPL